MIRSEAQHDELPEGWVLARLADDVIADVQPGFACGVNNRSGEGIAHLRPMNVNTDGEIDFSDLKYVPKENVTGAARTLQWGDVLFNNTNSPDLVGKTAVYEHAEPRAFSNHMTRVRCDREILVPRYLAMALHQKWREGHFENVCNNHVSQASVSRHALLDTEIPIPPLAEQKRIVAKVESLLQRVGAVRGRLAKVPEILRRFRQSTLAAACSGRLTGDWRDRVGTGPSVCNEEELDVLDEWPVPEIPAEWCWTTMRDVAEYQGGYAYRSKLFVEGETDNQVIRIGNVRPGHVDIDIAPVFISDDYARQTHRFQLHTNDVLISMTGTRYKRDYGNVGLVSESPRRLFLNQRVSRLIGRSHRVSPRFLHLWLQGETFRECFFRDETGNVNQGNVGAKPLKTGPIALPPLTEQHEIVRRVEALFKLADAIEARVAAATARADRLTQSILAQAFRGELVPTEAELAHQEARDYEPASVLLERIKAQRETPSIRSTTASLPCAKRRKRK